MTATLPSKASKPVPEIKSPKATYRPQNNRRILCVFPAYGRSFGTFYHSYPLTDGVKAFMPPQGILLIASYLPQEWEVRFVDENIQPAKDADYRWADVVITSGMHIQQPQLNKINEIAHQHNKITVIGGPSVSACPEYYPDFDILRMGELGDADDRLIELLDQSVSRPARQHRLATTERLPLADFPSPAYEHINLNNYYLGSVQFSSGCPFRCEFCDIPELYGRKPRLKSPEQILTELDAMTESGRAGAVYFVDDNFIGNRKAVMELLPHLIEWQKRNGYPLQFACEATLNIAQSPKILEMMREAYFTTVFCGIETPETDALHSISKDQNLSMPILDAINILNGYGLEVVSGIIIGFDTDTLQTGDRILDFIRRSHIPILTINLLYALPKTPLWRRLEQEDRLVLNDPGRESNVDFLLPYEDVVAMWQRCITEAYKPEFLYERFAYHVQNTYSNRVQVPNSTRATWPNIKRGLTLVGKILVKVGVFGNYRRTFWKMAWPLIKEGRIQSLIHTGLVGHHLITFAQECATGQESASFYSQKLRKAKQLVQSR
ncbi:MAG: DUF4070 domain-containing protein [Cyanobacteria bacterium P01_F01_bin.42]